MSNSLKISISRALLEGVMFFTFFTIMYKELYYRQDWLQTSTICSACWVLGCITNILLSLVKNVSIILRVVYEVIIIISISKAVILLINFFPCEYEITNTVIPFVVSLFIWNTED